MLLRGIVSTTTSAGRRSWLALFCARRRVCVGVRCQIDRVVGFFDGPLVVLGGDRASVRGEALMISAQEAPMSVCRQRESGWRAFARAHPSTAWRSWRGAPQNANEARGIASRASRKAETPQDATRPA